MTWQLKRTVALVGMMGAGKTAVGTQLARQLGVPFLDSDAEIVKAANMEIAEIFARDGEEFFRQRESEVLARLLRAPKKGVLSTGGGAFLRADNRALIAREGVAVWLRAPVELLWQRVRHKDTRPLLRNPDPRGTLARLAAEREPLYALAELSVEAEPQLSVEEMTAKVLEVLAAQPGVLERS